MTGCSGSTISANGGAGVGTAAVSHSASDPIKNESKKKLQGILSSIVTRGKGKRSERSATSTGSGSSNEDVVPMLESPTKKTRVMMEEDSKPSSADTTNMTAASATDTALPMPGKQECSKLDQRDEFSASDRASVFRQQPAMDGADFWNDEMEDMLELKQANPILDDGEEEEGNNVERFDPSQALTKELDEHVSGKPIMWSPRLQDDEDGFKIHFNPRE